MGLLDRLFGSRAPAPAQGLAMVLIQNNVMCDPAAAVRWLKEHYPGLPPITDLSTENLATTGKIPGGTVGLINVPSPVPAADLEGAIALAWHWPEAAEVVPRHRSHVICFASSSTMSLLDLRLLHTALVAAVTATTNASGVYLGDALMVREASAYLDEARAASHDDLPLLIWVGFNPVKTAGGHSAYTTGLTAFNLLELEIRDTELAWPALLSFMADVARYEIAGAVQVKDGETVGGSETERIRVRHKPSAFIPDMTVAVIER